MTESYLYYPERAKYNEAKSANPLAEDINYFRYNWKEEGLPRTWRDLPGTGFWMDTQMDLLIGQEKEVWLRQTEEDVKGFSLEYLAQGLTFPINYRIEEINGQDRVVAPLYGNKLMVDSVSEEERGGLVKDVLANKIEPFLLYSSNGSIAIMTSPSGRSGLKSPEGKEIIFPDSQTYILQKKGKEIVGFTVRTDFTKEEHRQFINGLGGEIGEDPSDTEILDNTIFLSGEKADLEISDIAFSMQKTRKEVTGNIFAYKNRLWDEVYQDLLRRDELWSFDEITSQYFEKFKDYVNYNFLDEKETREALAVTILRIAESLRPGIEYRKENNIPMGSILEHVQSLPGCAGGGGRFNVPSLVNSLTPRFGEKSWSFDKEGECVICHAESKALGPCGICKPCNDKIDAQEIFSSKLS